MRTISNVNIRYGSSKKHLFSFLIDPYFYLVVCIFAGEATLASVGLFVEIHSSAFYLIFAFSVLLFMIDPKANKKMRFSINLILIFYLYLVLRNITSNETKIHEWLMPNFVTLLCFMLISFLNIGKPEIYKISKYTYFFVSILMLLGIGKALVTRSVERLSVFGGPNGFYKFAMLFEALSYGKYCRTRKIRYLFAMIIGILLAILTGSKGAFFCIAIVVPIEYIHFCYLKHKSLFKTILKLMIFMLILFGIFFILYSELPHESPIWISLERIMGIFSSDVSNLSSVSTRVQMYEMSMDYFKEKPIFGMGGMYMYLSTNDEYFPYAHNIFFEMLGEQGIIGFSLVVLILLKTVFSLKNHSRDSYFFGLFCGFLIYLIGAQFSGNILDSKVIFFFALLIFSYKKKRKEFSYVKVPKEE